MQTRYALSRAEYEREVDVTLAGSFPASDPPPWTLGASPWMGVEAPAAKAPVPAAVDVVLQSGRRFAGFPLAGLGEAFFLAAAVPLGLLIVGVPIVAMVWWLASAVASLTGGG